VLRGTTKFLSDEKALRFATWIHGTDIGAIDGQDITILTNDSPSCERKGDETMVICCAPVTCSITVQAPPDRINPEISA
jgi:hypothetical protein